MKHKEDRRHSLGGYTRAFGTGAEAREVASTVEQMLRTSRAWAAYVEEYGPGPMHGFVWVGIDGGPFTPIEYGLSTETGPISI